jgi:peptidoglycan/xylan/chitin deacetylase (PgdA/CDA1 family)
MIRLIFIFLFFLSFTVSVNGQDTIRTKKKVGRKGVPILVFHRIGNHWGEYRLSIKEFNRIFKALRKNNFYPVSLDEIMSNTFRKECWGKKLFCINFDDAHSSQIRFLKDRILDSTSMVGVILKYFDNPRATFFINTNNRGTPPWAKDSKLKMEYLISKGMIMGNHSARHKRLDFLSTKDMFAELGEVFEYTGSDSMFLSYPYGSVLKNEKLLRNGFEYKNRLYRIIAAFTEYEEIDVIKTFWDRLQMIRYLCPLGNTDEFERRRYELPRINITSFDGFYVDVIKNTNVLQIDSVHYRLSSDSSYIEPLEISQ